jgi:hypothetical protein
MYNTTTEEAFKYERKGQQTLEAAKKKKKIFRQALQTYISNEVRTSETN